MPVVEDPLLVAALERPSAARGPAVRSSEAGDEKTVEQKYAFSATVIHRLQRGLDDLLLPDPVHHRGEVSSIYFDSPEWHLYFEKRNSDYLKTKVRLRWYGSLTHVSPDAPVHCFLEVKRKFGAIRDKHRIPVTMPARVLQRAPFSDSRILGLMQLLLEHGIPVPQALTPLIIVQYQRRRYLEMESGSRIAFDTSIGCPRVNERLMGAVASVWLPVGVLEVKGPRRHLPVALNGLAGDLRKEAFSKYALCCEALSQPLGRRL